MKLLKLKGWTRLLWVILGLALALVVYGLLQLIEPVAVQSPRPASGLAFQGRALLVASDADMVATAYADAKLDRIPGVEDALTVLPLPLDPENPEMLTLPVSNSVMSWPQIIAISPNGERAYVAEVRSRPADGIQELESIDEMPAGANVTVVDISNLSQPSILESVNVGRNPEHLSISPDGRFLAVNLNEPGRELLIVEIQPDGTLGQRSYFPMELDGTRRDNRAAIWHPSGRYLAMTQDNNRRIGFYQVQATNGAIAITPVAEPLTIGNHLSNPRFTADGRFLLVPDLKWSLYPNPSLNFLLNPPGEMIAIQFEPNSGTPARVVSRVEVGLSPEGFDLSPDNTLIATVNMRRTYLPSIILAWRGRSYSSLSLVQFDPESGRLTALDEYGFEGLLPEQAVFDQTGQALAVVIYNYREAQPRTGAVEFWAVAPGESPQLERTDVKIDVVRGPHDIRLLP